LPASCAHDASPDAVPYEPVPGCQPYRTLASPGRSTVPRTRFYDCPSPYRSLFLRTQPATAAPAELTATLTWRMEVPAGVAKMAGAGHDPAAGSVALATLIAPVEELYCPHPARTLPVPSAPSATGPVNDMPVPLTTAGPLHPAAAVHTDDSITVSADRCAAQAKTAEPSGRITTAGEVAVWPAGDSAATLDHPADGVRTLALTWPLPVHATTAVPDACPAVTRADMGAPATVASVTGADHVVAALRCVLATDLCPDQN